MNILDKLADLARGRVLEDQKQEPAALMAEKAEALGPGGGAAFTAALRRPGDLAFLCEVKRASPSKGLIAPDFPYLQIARDYEEAGADCLSVLTEPFYFQGSDQIFREIRHAVSAPMLRKDFTVSPYQLDQACCMGADAVLLIVALLNAATLEAWLGRCEVLGLAALVETHDEAEIDTAVRAGARIIGVNNRNLKDFSVDLGNAARLREHVPPECVFVAESGVRSPEDVARLRRIGADAVLVGEALMRSENKKARLHELRHG